MFFKKDINIYIIYIYVYICAFSIISQHCDGEVNEWVINSLSRTVDSLVHITHMSCVIITYTRESLSPPHIYNPQSTGYNWLKNKMNTKEHKILRAPIKLTCHWRWQLYIIKSTQSGWLYFFSSFPPRLPPRRPPPQQLLPLTSKPFEINLTYLAQRIYGSGEMYWVTFPWPWPKVTAVVYICKNLLVCTIM